MSSSAGSPSRLPPNSNGKSKQNSFQCGQETHATNSNTQEEDRNGYAFGKEAATTISSQPKHSKRDSGWDFNTIRLSSSNLPTTEQSVAPVAQSTGSGRKEDTTAPVSSDDAAIDTVNQRQHFKRDSGWNFDTVRLSTSALSMNESSASTNWSLPPVPKSIQKQDVHASPLQKPLVAPASNLQRDDPQEESELDGDEVAFMNIVKPAIFDVLEEIVNPPPGRSNDSSDVEAQEELLFDFLHSFETLTQERGLLRKVLNSLIVYGSPSMASTPSRESS